MSDNGERFKIDAFDSDFFPFAIYIRQRRWIGRDKWLRLKFFEKIEEARAYYGKIKDLPEYLP